jgi:hypothetical protein
MVFWWTAGYPIAFLVALWWPSLEAQSEALMLLLMFGSTALAILSCAIYAFRGWRGARRLIAAHRYYRREWLEDFRQTSTKAFPGGLGLPHSVSSIRVHDGHRRAGDLFWRAQLVKTYEVESEVLYLFAVQAANETDARHFAEYSLAKG